MQIFLTSAEADHQIATALARCLSKTGHRVIYPNEFLGEGDNWTLRIGQALEKSDAMIAVVSSRSRNSELFKHEVDFALGSEGFEGRLISVLVGRPRPFPWILKKLPVVRYNSRAENVDEVTAKVSNLLSLPKTAGVLER